MEARLTVPKAVAPETFSGEIRVAARVIDFLSSGLYKNAAACMKELINNSYDADATAVVVSVKPDADMIAIEDDGTGMSRAQFETHFSRVAESHKRDDGEATASGRQKIGKIGIGFVAANELCDEMEIYSTQAGSTELLHVTIDFGKIRDQAFPERRQSSGDVHKGDYSGEMLEEPDKDSHYTRIFLKRIRATAIDSFVKETGEIEDAPVQTIYGLKSKSVGELLKRLTSWDQLDLYSQTRAQIGLNVPVEYLPDWAPTSCMKDLEKFSKRARKNDFQVIYDGTPLTKPIVLPELRGRSIIHPLKLKTELITVEGYLYASHGAVRPNELNGVLIRVRESAVGSYDSDFVGYPKQIDSLFQDWVSGEVYVDGKLDEAVNIDRRTLRDTHPAYVQLKEYLLGELRIFFASARRELYSKPSAQRRAEKRKADTEAFAQIAKRIQKDYGAAAARGVMEAWTAPSSKTSSGRPRNSDLSQTFSVNEIYQIALDVAEAVLPKDLAAEYIAELTRRLRG